MICYLYYDTPEHPDTPAALAYCRMSACRASSAVKEEGTWQEKPTFFSLGGHQSDHSSMIVKNGSVCLSHPRVFTTGPGVVRVILHQFSVEYFSGTPNGTMRRQNKSI